MRLFIAIRLSCEMKRALLSYCRVCKEGDYIVSLAGVVLRCAQIIREKQG